MYIYVYICIYILCIYIYILCIYVYIYYVYVYIYIFIYIYAYLYIYICLYVYIYIYMLYSYNVCIIFIYIILYIYIHHIFKHIEWLTKQVPKWDDSMILQAVYISARPTGAPMSMFKWMLMDVSRCLTICLSICFVGVELWQLCIYLDVSRCLWIFMVCISIHISWALYQRWSLQLFPRPRRNVIPSVMMPRATAKRIQG